MGRTCEPASLANQIVQAAFRLVGEAADLAAWEEAARREFERYTAGLYDFERQEVLLAMAALMHGRTWG